MYRLRECIKRKIDRFKTDQAAYTELLALAKKIEHCAEEMRLESAIHKCKIQIKVLEEILLEY